jgi:hypothetical protein
MRYSASPSAPLFPHALIDPGCEWRSAVHARTVLCLMCFLRPSGIPLLSWRYSLVDVSKNSSNPPPRGARAPGSSGTVRGGPLRTGQDDIFG